MVDVAWALVVPAYLLGTFPTAILVGRQAGADPTKEGSGNPGASNVMRTMGRRAGAFVLAGDLGKGVVATLAGLATGHRSVAVACGVASVIGHIAPVTRRFRGGKGVATAAGVVLVLLPLAALVLAVLWVVVTRISGAASAGSIAVALATAPAAAVAGRGAGEVAALAACAGLVVVRHKENIGRLRRGEEHGLRERAPRVDG